jgi:predicted O-methyltransferase YrrM
MMDYRLAHDKISKLVEQIYQIPVYSDTRFPPSLYYRFLRSLTAWWKPNLSVELGLCGGGGSLHMALGYPDGKVIGIDITDDYHDNRRYIEQMCDNFIYWKRDSVESAKWVDMPVDILFIDTVHTYERTMAEYNAWFPELNGNAIIVLDDLFEGDMEHAWNEIQGYHIRLDNLHPKSELGGGFGIILI